MKLKELVKYAQSKYNTTIPMSEESGNQEWVEIQGYDNIHEYIGFQKKFIVLGLPSYRLEGNQQGYECPRLFIPKEAAKRLFYYGEEEKVLPNQVR